MGWVCMRFCERAGSYVTRSGLKVVRYNSRVWAASVVAMFVSHDNVAPLQLDRCDYEQLLAVEFMHLSVSEYAFAPQRTGGASLDTVRPLPQMTDATAATDGVVVAAPMGDQLEFDPATPWTAIGSSS